MISYWFFLFVDNLCFKFDILSFGGVTSVHVKWKAESKEKIKGFTTSRCRLTAKKVIKNVQICRSLSLITFCTIKIIVVLVQKQRCTKVY